MGRTELLQELRKMRFEQTYEGLKEGRLTQAEAAQILGMCERSFRRYVARFTADGLQGLIDQRLEQVSNRRAPVDEVLALTERYRSEHVGWNMHHFHSWYRRDGGTRSYSWVRKCLQKAGLVKHKKARGVHRKRRERMPLPGMMLHQDASTHPWIADQSWDLVVTMDDATSEHYSMFFVEQEGTWSSLQGVDDVIRAHGLFSSFYSDRGSHYWHTPEAGQGRQDQPDAVRACAQAARHRHDRGILPGGTWTFRARLRDTPGSFAAGTGQGGRYQLGRCQPLPEEGLYAALQQGVCATGDGNRVRLRALDWNQS